ncbi:IlvD/Edd family dehydratase [Phytoactinopolyspora endophytica]|uniref:IlvD/Edd family dehydratase n=1 Tax=Phytoactinopolyspora endophytica TaxID=1642495 RepID=UPI00101B781B|nr:IlvD/Edd family dehydratase [Phytoactinopolyspora endophytica]
MGDDAEVKLRSQQWFDNPDDPEMTALYVERYLNWGLSREELQSGKPIIGIAQSGSDLAPCNRHHVVLAERIREGIREAGGIAFEFPVHPIQETGRRPTASLDRNLAYLGLVETLHGYPLDGVVLTTGCDKTTPSQLMAAATVNIPAIALSVGPMLNGWHKGERAGSGTMVWRARKMLSAGEIDKAEYIEMVASAAPSPGFCNTMGTATTMNSLAEALGMMLPGSAAIPAVHKERGKAAYLTGRRAVEMVREDLRPSDVMTKKAFENAVVVCSAIGGSTNAPIHLNAIARHLGVELTNDEWEKLGYPIPLLVDLQPAGRFLGEDFHRAGGIPAVVAELLAAGALPHPDAVTVNGTSIGDNCAGRLTEDREVIREYGRPMVSEAGFRNLKGNLFASAIMKTSVISPQFRATYLSNPDDPDAFEGHAVVFDGREDYHARLNDPSLQIDEQSLLFIRGAGPLGHPGGAEVVNMDPPAELLRRGITELPCVGDGRQSGTSGSPSILNASPEAAVGGGLALLRTGDRVRVDLGTGEVNMLVDDEELERRRIEVDKALANGGLHYIPESQTPWQEIHRDLVGQFDEGMVLKPAVKYRDVARRHIPRDNH